MRSACAKNGMLYYTRMDTDTTFCEDNHVIWQWISTCIHIRTGRIAKEVSYGSYAADCAAYQQRKNLGTVPAGSDRLCTEPGENCQRRLGYRLSVRPNDRRRGISACQTAVSAHHRKASKARCHRLPDSSVIQAGRDYSRRSKSGWV